MTETTITADVVICTYSFKRWDLLVRAVDSVLSQTVAPKRLIIVVDHNDALFQQCREQWGSSHLRRGIESTVTANEFAGRLGSARNTGLLYTASDVVAFLDDDAEATPNWLETLLGVYRTHPEAVAVGGAPRPNYGGRRPDWFPPEFDWVFGCHYSSLPDHLAPIPHLIGASMSVRRDAILAAGGFHADDHDDMDLSHRIAHEHGAQAVLYEPRAEIRHFVPAERLTWSYFWRRCFNINRSKAGVVEHMQDAGNLAAEFRFAMGILLSLGPAAVAGLTGRPQRITQVLAAMSGLTVAAIGYALGKAEVWRGEHPEMLTTGLSPADILAARGLEQHSSVHA